MVKVNICIQGNEMNLTIKEAEYLYNQLHLLLGKGEIKLDPYIPHYPPSVTPDECTRIMPPYIVTCDSII
jgi:hypothetical protein